MKTINLDEIKSNIAFQFGGKTYEVKDLDGRSWLRWREAMRRRNRLERKQTSLEEALTAGDENADGEIAKIEAQISELDASMLVTIVPGLTQDIVLSMSFLQRGKILQAITDSHKDLLSEVESGEATSQA